MEKGQAEMKIEEKIMAVRAMEENGGSFVQTIALAWRLADPDNRQRIEATWPELFSHYLEMFCK